MNVFIFRKRRKVCKRVAIISPNDNIVCREARSGIISALLEDDDLLFQYSIIDSKDDIKLLQNKVSYWLDNDTFDVLLTLGKFATQTAKLLTEEKSIRTPIVFGGVMEPIESGLIQSYEDTGNHLTGVSADKRDYCKQLRALVTLFKVASSSRLHEIALVRTGMAYDMNNHDLARMEREAQLHGVKLINFCYETPEQFENELRQMQRKNAIVMIGRDNKIISNIASVARVCYALRIPLVASDLESIKHGAAIGIGDFESSWGANLGRKAMEVLNLPNTRQVPRVFESRWNLKSFIEPSVACMQGLDFDFDKLGLSDNFEMKILEDMVR